MAGLIKTLGRVTASGIDVTRRSVPFVVTDAVDEHGTSVPPEGLRLDRFRSNPVFLWMHRSHDTELHQVDPDDVIGRVSQIDVIDGHLVFEAEFAEHDLADRCFRAVVEGRLNSVSISFKQVVTHPEGDVIVVDVAELFEISLVIIGSNPEALALRNFIEADMNPEILKKLGLEDKAGPGDILVALAQYLARTDEDKSFVEEVLKMLPSASSSDDESSGGTEQNRSNPDGKAEAQDDQEKRSIPLMDEVKRLNTRLDELERRSSPHAMAAAARAEIAKIRVNESSTRQSRSAMVLGGPSGLPKPPATENSVEKDAKAIIERSKAQLSVVSNRK